MFTFLPGVGTPPLPVQLMNATLLRKLIFYADPHSDPPLSVGSCLQQWGLFQPFLGYSQAFEDVYELYFFFFVLHLNPESRLPRKTNSNRTQNVKNLEDMLDEKTGMHLWWAHGNTEKIINKSEHEASGSTDAGAEHRPGLKKVSFCSYIHHGPCNCLSNCNKWANIHFLTDILIYSMCLCVLLILRLLGNYSRCIF